MNVHAEHAAIRLEYALNEAFHTNAFNGFDASEFDVDAYLVPDSKDAMHGFDGYDVTELTEHRSPSANFSHDEDDDEPWDGFNSDAEADADVLANCGWGTDEDYGYYGEE